MKRSSFVVALTLVCLILVSVGARAEGKPGTTETVVTASGQVAEVGWARVGKAPTIWEIMERIEMPTRVGYEAEIPIQVPERLQNLRPVTENGPDPLAQPFGVNDMPAAELSFEGYDSDDNVTAVGGRVMPPDTNGDVGVDYYVQYNNLGWEYYDKETGVKQGGPFPGNSFWDGFGGICDTGNAGDPVVLFDHIAGQWVFSQFASSGGRQCFAVSAGTDPTGPYALYDFQISPTSFNDYPKIGIWSDTGGQSAYHMTSNQFTGGFSGVQVTAFDRDAMLAGEAASFIKFSLPPAQGSDPFAFSLQPPHLEGDTLPVGKYCGRYIQVFDNETWGDGTGADGYRFWDFCTNFDSPGQASFTERLMVTAPEFDASLCGFSRSCVPQPGTTQKLDTLGQFTMYRFNMRVVDDEVRGLITHSVDLNPDESGADPTLAGIRYAYFNMSVDVSFVPVFARVNGINLRDTGTLAVGDGVNRWMPSGAIDQAGNLAIGYTKASSSIAPSAYFTGRLDTDPAGELRNESVCVDGTGVQLGGNRWGDYAAASVDPEDGCTFYLTNEFVETTGSFEWDNQICSFSFDSCTGAGPEVEGAAAPYVLDSCSYANGRVICKVSGATPGAVQRLMRSADRSSGAVPGGACRGASAGLSNSMLFGRAIADSNGNAEFVFSGLSAAPTGQFVQAIDEAGSCAVSGVVPVRGK